MRYGDKMEKSDFVNGMSICADAIHNTLRCDGFQIIGECPVPFKAGVSDKLIFRQTLDKLMPVIPIRNSRGNEVIVGTNIMNVFYYPQYGWWDDRELMETKREFGGQR